MSQFSEMLEFYMNKSGMTEYQLAKLSGFPRSYIALMKNGTRVSPDMEKMEKLLSSLRIPIRELDEVWAAYRKERMGERLCRQHEQVQKVLERFGRISKVWMPIPEPHNLKNKKVFSGKAEVKELLKAVLQAEALKEEGSVGVILQGESQFLQTQLTELCENGKNLIIEHIVCLQNQEERRKQRNQQFNVEHLQWISPILLSGKKNYHMYYYYDEMSSHINEMNVMPYFVVTSSYAVVIDYEFEMALSLPDTDAVQFYQDIFRRQKQRCFPLIEYVTDVFSLKNYYERAFEQQNPLNYLSFFPFMPGAMFDQDFLQRFFYEEGRTAKYYSEFADIGKKFHSQKDSKITVYYSEEALEMFVRTGKVSDEKEDSIKTVDVSLRKEALMRFQQYGIEEFKNMHPIYFGKFRIPINFIMLTGNPDEILLALINKKKYCFLTIKEKTIINAINSFMNELQVLNFVMSERDRKHLFFKLQKEIEGMEMLQNDL